MAHPQPLLALVGDLQRRELTLPEDVLRGCELLRRFSPDQLFNHDQIVERRTPASLLALTEDEIWAHIDRHVLLHHSFAEVTDTIDRVVERLAAETAAVLLAGLDDVLDHLRPAFDAAGLAVHRAVQLGIKPTTDAAAVLGLSDAAVAAWRALPDHLRVLDDLAQLRIRFTDVGADPLPDRYDPGGRPAYASCFVPGGVLPWSIGHETAQGRWLRLATPKPVRLLTVAETRQLASQARTLPAPFEMVEDDDGTMRYAGVRQS